MKIEFKGFDDLIERINKAGGNAKEAAEEALEASQKYIQEQLTAAAAPYASKGLKGYAAGEMFDAIIKDPQVTWEGSVASVPVGFDLKKKGGYHSIFIMYGTAAHGKNKGIRKDANIYNAIRGTKTKKEIARIQEEIMKRRLALTGPNG